MRSLDPITLSFLILILGRDWFGFHSKRPNDGIYLILFCLSTEKRLDFQKKKEKKAEFHIIIIIHTLHITHRYSVNHWKYWTDKNKCIKKFNVGCSIILAHHSLTHHLNSVRSPFTQRVATIEPTLAFHPEKMYAAKHTHTHSHDRWLGSLFYLFDVTLL